MQAVREQAALAKSHGLFRAASAVDVTCIIAREMMGFGERSSSSRFTSLPEVAQVDVFISHSLKCPCFLRFLSVCHYLNWDVAIFFSVVASLLAACGLVWHAGSFSAAARQQGLLFGCLYACPMLIFLLAYVSGHLCSKMSFWFDRLCIDQENLLLKCRSLHAIPAIVAHSKRMIVLWDETYFERLWCVYELAIHSKAGSAAIEVIPTWMPVYTVLWIITSLLGGYVYFQSDSRQQFDTETPSSLFFSVFSSGFMPLITYPIIAIPVAAICFGKLQHHKRMLDQMASFDLRNAKCTLETDRLLIEEQVVSLFDEALEPPLSVAFGTEADEGSENLLSPRTLRDIRPVTSYPTNDQIIDQFNAYVRGPLRDSVLESTGQENHISFKLCVFSLWPWLCLAMIRELGCDGADDADCEQAASQAGFDSVWQYTATNILYEVYLSPAGTALIVPVLLLTCDWVNQLGLDPAVRGCLGSCLCACMMLLADVHVHLEYGMLMVAAVKNSPIWLTVLILSILLDLWLMWFLFFRKRHQSHPRMLVRG